MRFTGEAADPRWRSDLLPAPGELRLVQALLNTKAGKKPEQLAGPGQLTDWLALWGLLSRSIGLGKAELQRAIAVREGLRALARARTDAALQKAAGILDRQAKETLARVRFDADGRARYEPSADDFDGALVRIFQIVMTAQNEALWPRLKICPEKDCGQAFYDFSKNRAARWCQPKCGNRQSARDYRNRTRRYY